MLRGARNAITGAVGGSKRTRASVAGRVVELSWEQAHVKMLRNVYSLIV